MASSNNSQRKKRAWRKPREAVGPGGEMGTEAKQVKINRVTLKSTPPSEAPMDDSSCKDTSKSAQQHESPMEVEIRDRPSVRSNGAAAAAKLAAIQRDASSPIEIDGSVLEGGGQILRNSMSLSCLLKQPIHILHIRAGRDKPGLAAQHLTGIQLVSNLCGGSLIGDVVRSMEVTFEPKTIVGGEFTADTRTAGSVCLLLQVALPCLLFAPKPSKLTLKGGTNADFAPPIDYITKVFLPIAMKFGIRFDCHIKRRGFYPKGQGEVIITTSPVTHLTPVDLTDPGQLVGVKIHSFVAGHVSPKASDQMVQAAKKIIERQLPGVPIEVNQVEETAATAYGNSSGIIIVAETSTGCRFGGSANGRKTCPAEKTGKMAAEELVNNVKSGGCVDDHLQDQLIILMALAKGRSVIRTGPITLHTQTAIHIAKALAKAKFKVRKLEGKQDVNLIECEGIGLENKFLLHHNS